MRSQRIGLRLYGIALDPICLLSNGSSSSLRLLRSRMSVAILWRTEATLARSARIKVSMTREYV